MMDRGRTEEVPLSIISRQIIAFHYQP
jgi:hypothetical protein